MAWMWWHGGVMGVTDAGEGASAPLPPDGIQPHPPTPPNTSVRIFFWQEDG